MLTFSYIFKLVITLWILTYLSSTNCRSIIKDITINRGVILVNRVVKVLT